MDNARFFLGLSFSPQQINELQNQLSLLRKSIRRVRWIRPENIHMTLHFFGNMPLEALSEIKEASVQISRCCKPIELALSGIGCFPKASVARILWAGVKGDTAEMSAFHTHLEEKLKTLGFPLEERPFTPHVTLGRAEKNSPMEFLQKPEKLSALISTGSALLDKMILFQSHLTSSGVRYEKIEKFPFLGNA